MIIKSFDRKSSLFSSEIEFFTLATVCWTSINSKPLLSGFFECTKVDSDFKNQDSNSCSTSLIKLFEKQSKQTLKSDKSKQVIFLIDINQKFTDILSNYIFNRDNFITNFNKFTELQVGKIRRKQFPGNENRSIKISSVFIFNMHLFFRDFSELVSRSEASDMDPSLNEDALILRYTYELKNMLNAELPQINLKKVKKFSASETIFKKHIAESLGDLSLKSVKKKNSVLNNLMQKIFSCSAEGDIDKDFYFTMRLLFQIHLNFAKCLISETIYPYFEDIIFGGHMIEKADFEFIEEVFDSIKINFKLSEVFDMYIKSDFYISLSKAILNEFKEMCIEANLLQDNIE